MSPNKIIGTIKNSVDRAKDMVIFHGIKPIKPKYVNCVDRDQTDLTEQNKTKQSLIELCEAKLDELNQTHKIDCKIRLMWN